MHLRSWLIALALCCTLALTSTARDRTRDLDETERPSPPVVVDTRSQADVAQQQGDYPKVIELTNWLIDNFPKDHPYFAFHLRASAKIEMGRVAGSGKLVREGISDARLAILADGAKYPWLHIPYAYGLSTLAEIERRPEHAELAIKVVSSVLAAPPTKEFTDEDRANLFYQRGLAFAAKNDLKAAAADQSEAIRLSPNHLGAHVKRAAMLAALGKTKEAQAAYDEAVNNFPNVLLVYNDRGAFRRNTRDLDGAIGDFTRCLEIDPTFAVGFLNRGFCLADQNSPQAAEGDFSAALKLKLDVATSGIAYRFRATARLLQGNAAAAIADFNAAIKADPRDATLYEERGFANFFNKSFPAAISDFSKAMQMNPKAIHLLPWQALALSRSGQSAEGRVLLESAPAGKTPPTGWVAKLDDLLLDKISADELLEAVLNPDPNEKNRRLCEAQFFIGQKQLLHEEATTATSHFREALACNEHSLSAFRGARYELNDFKQDDLKQ